MLRNLTIGKRITLGFGTVLLFLIAVVVLSYTGVGGIVDDATEVIVGNQLDGEMAQKEVDHLIWSDKVSALLTDDSVTTLDVQLDPTQCAFGKWLYGEGREHAEEVVPALSSLLQQIEKPHADLHASARAIGERFKPADRALGNFLREKKADHLAWAHKVKDVFIDMSLNTVEAEMDPTKCGLGRWMSSPEVAGLRERDPEFAAAFDKIVEPHRALHESAHEIQRLLDNGERDQARTYYMQNTKAHADQCLAAIDGLLAWHDARMDGMTQACAVFAQQTKPDLEKVRTLLHKIRSEVRDNVMTDDAMLGAATRTQWSVLIVGALATLIGLGLSFAISRGLIKVLKRLIAQLGEGAQQVGEAASQVSSASQQLAEGASEQASSLEETSSALEQMAAMTRTNAEHAGQANLLASEASTAAQEGEATTTRLNESMAAINTSSDQISKIIKAIEEIAFQTNLLALNAAVEAARAGEHGKGFAVVAEEVRNLAQRAAEAARETTELIDESVNRAREGTEVAGQVSHMLESITASVTKVSDLIEGIARASQEQSQGIEQINMAVAQMDKVTQANAGGAEETASAAEELNAQAQTVKGLVGELVQLSGGKVSDSGIRPSVRPVAQPGGHALVHSGLHNEDVSVGSFESPTL